MLITIEAHIYTEYWATPSHSQLLDLRVAGEVYHVTQGLASSLCHLLAVQLFLEFPTLDTYALVTTRTTTKSSLCCWKLLLCLHLLDTHSLKYPLNCRPVTRYTANKGSYYIGHTGTTSTHFINADFQVFLS